MTTKVQNLKTAIVASRKTGNIKCSDQVLSQFLSDLDYIAEENGDVLIGKLEPSVQLGLILLDFSFHFRPLSLTGRGLLDVSGCVADLIFWTLLGRRLHFQCSW